MARNPPPFPLLTCGDSSHQRALRLGTAAAAALTRIRPAELAQPEDAFAAIGEALVWLVALEDLLIDADEDALRKLAQAHADGQLMSGVRLARNAAIHGLDVISFVEIDPHGSALGSFALGATSLGAAPSIEWLARSSMDYTPRPTRYTPVQQQTYDAQLAGREVAPLLGRALGFLREVAGI